MKKIELFFCPLCERGAKRDLEDIGVFYCDRCKIFFDRDGNELDPMERFSCFVEIAKQAFAKLRTAALYFAEKVGPEFRRAVEKIKEKYPDLEEQDNDDGPNEVSP